MGRGRAGPGVRASSRARSHHPPLGVELRRGVRSPPVRPLDPACRGGGHSVRIALICPPWLAVPPKGYGGIEWVVSMEADGLAEAGHDVTLFATGDSVTKARLEYVFDVAPGSKAINDVTLDTTHTLFSLRDVRDRFAGLHVHSPFSALAAAIETGIPTVHTLHGSFTPEMKRLYSYIGQRAWFVAISEAQRAFEPDLHYGGVVYNGIDMDRYP